MKLNLSYFFFNCIGYRYWPIETSDFRNQSNIPYWYRKNPSAVSIETTSYALLTQLELDKIIYSHNIVEWLIEQQQASGAFISTQVIRRDGFFKLFNWFQLFFSDFFSWKLQDMDLLKRGVDGLSYFSVILFSSQNHPWIMNSKTYLIKMYLNLIVSNLNVV